MESMRVRKSISKVGIARALVLGGLVACGGSEDGSSGGGPPGRAGGGPPPMPVDVAATLRDTAIEQVVATGEVEAIQAIEVRPDVEGRIVQIYFREGSEVRRGAALLKIDDAELQAQVARLEAQRDLADQSLRRTEALLAQNAASQAELEEAEARARSARAELELQRLRLERTVVRAPFSGVAGERLVSLGDYVTTATPLLSLQTVHPQRASFDVPERYASDLAIGQQVRFEVAAVPGREFVGEVDFVDPRVRLPARTIQIKAVVPNPDRTLQAGMFVEARLATDVRPDALWIPEEAVVQLDAGTFVWVVGAQGQAFRKPVSLGVRRPGLAEVLTGLSEGEPVITAGMERLFEGASVMPRQALDTGPPPTPGAAPGPPGVGPRPDSSAAGA